MKPGYRIGTGFDVHELVGERRLVLGGVEIPAERGALGHSDADVACHALVDAIFGALGEGDIGYHFPDTDPTYKDISSLELVERASKLMRDSGHTLANADITIILEAPKISRWRQAMREALAGAAGVTPDRINVKATTSEGLGFTGRGEGVAAQAVVLLEYADGR